MNTRVSCTRVLFSHILGHTKCPSRIRRPLDWLPSAISESRRAICQAGSEPAGLCSAYRPALTPRLRRPSHSRAAQQPTAPALIGTLWFGKSGFAHLVSALADSARQTPDFGARFPIGKRGMPAALFNLIRKDACNSHASFVQTTFIVSFVG